MENIVLELKNVSKSFGKRNIINNLSLKVEAGQIYGFLGANGTGKTTTIKMIVHLLSKDSGKIYINGIDIDKDYEKAMKYVGAIVENPDLYSYLTGRENLELFAKIRNVDKKSVEDAIKIVGLEGRIDEKVKNYSLGMKQRLGIAVSIMHKPKLLILDEPTNGLDPAGIKELRKMLEKLSHDSGTAVFVSSHLLSEMEILCDKVAIINEGKIVRVGNVKDIEKGSNNEYVIKVDNIEKAKNILEKLCKYEIDEDVINVEYEDDISDVIKALWKEDIKVVSFNKKEYSLEDKFFEIIGGK